MLKKLIITSVFIIISLVVLVQYPNLFIQKSGTYKSFEIYANQEIEIDESVKRILDSVQVNLDQSQFKEASHQYELYFVAGSFYEKLIRLLGRKNIAFSKFDKHIYSAKPYFEKGILKRNNNDYDWLNLVQIISHEAVHSQMYKDYYKHFKMQTPHWINEGYAEYISYQPIRESEHYELLSLFNKLESDQNEWLQTEYHTMTPREYVKSRLLIEYLIDVKHMNITEIISDTATDPDEVYREIKDYFDR